MKGLSILPPCQKTTAQRRQNKGEGEKADNDDGDEEDGWGGGMALPPLRPEEPVASLRGALGEVLGFAHLTRYRLVVERVRGCKNGARIRRRRMSSRIRSGSRTVARLAAEGARRSQAQIIIGNRRIRMPAGRRSR